MKKKHMTLLEMVVVLAVIGILIGMVVGAIAKVGHKGKVVKAMAMMKGIQTAVAEYERRYGVMPGGQFDKTAYTANSGQTIKFDDLIGSYSEMLARLVNYKDQNGKVSIDNVSYKKANENDPDNPVHIINADGVCFLKPESSNKEYRDPWKKGYAVYLDVDLDGKIWLFDFPDSKCLDGRAQIYSFGPNKTDDKGTKDDITTWRKDN